MNTVHKRGFTLIELLVVIGIIGVLASIVLASLDGARKKGRDARRISDVKQIQLALELYYDANASFPPSISSTAASCGASACATLYLVTPGYISVVPKDPQNNRDYSYTPYYASGAVGAGQAVCSSYHLGTSLETVGHPAFQTDVDGTALSTVCTAQYSPSADFDGTDLISASPHKCNNNDFGAECYDVKP
jgi:prepilin-type N-terminal cleavage/methylation domain-containing protein